VIAAPPLDGRISWRVLIPFTLVTLLWGGTWIVIRDQLGVVPPNWSITYRFILASATMFAYAAWTRTPLRLSLANQLFAVAIGCSIFVFNFNLVYRAEAYVTSGLVAVVFALLVVPNALFGRLFLGQALSLRFLAGSTVALVGLAVLFAHELQRGGGGSNLPLGIGMTLAAVIMASIANVMQGSERGRSMPVAAQLAWSMLWGAVINFVLALVVAGPPQFDWRIGYIAGIVYLGVAGSALAFTLYFGVIRAIGPARAAYSSVLIPIIALAISTIFEGFRWSAQAAVGAALTLAGLWVAIRARSPA
jgi:drug/metabolite transporter (DMT)-like permease